MRRILAGWLVLMVLTGIFMLAPVGPMPADAQLKVTIDGVSYATHNPIMINKTTEPFSFVNGISSGTGKYEDPWIIKGWRINGSATGYCIAIEDVSGCFQIEDCYLYGAVQQETYQFYVKGGIYIHAFESDGFCLIKNNVITGNTAGIKCSGDKDVYIRSNQISNNRWGISGGTEHLGIENNTVVNNSYIGIEAWSDWVGYVRNNVVLNNSEVGISVTDSEGMIVSNNTVMNHTTGIIGFIGTIIESNTVAGNDKGIFPNSDNNVNGNIIHNNTCGIFCEYSSKNSLMFNQIRDNQYGIYLAESYYNLAGLNNISFNEYGIYMTNSSLDNRVRDNSIYDNSYGIYLDNCTDNLIYHNNILSNAIQAFDSMENDWNNVPESGGNFWGSFSTDNDSDGFIDESYPIIGGNNADLYPLAEESALQYPGASYPADPPFIALWIFVTIIAGSVFGIFLSRKVKAFHNWFSSPGLKILFALFLVFVMIGAGNTIYVSYEGYGTALELKEMADELALEWQPDATLERISSYPGKVRPDGRSTAWSYTYYSPSSAYFNEDYNRTEMEVAYIEVHANGNSFIRAVDNNMGGFATPLLITMDTDEAFHIAMEDNAFRQFIEKYWDAGIGMNCQGDWPSQGWSIEATANYGIDEDFNDARVFINGWSGFIEYTEISENGRTLFYVCEVCPVMGFILLVAGGVWFSRWRNKRRQKKTG